MFDDWPYVPTKDNLLTNTTNERFLESLGWKCGRLVVTSSLSLVYTETRDVCTNADLTGSRTYVLPSQSNMTNKFSERGEK